MLRDYAIELTNLDAFNGAALVDSNLVDDHILSDIYTTLANTRMSSAANSYLPSPNTIDSLWYIARQPGQVTLCGLYFQYSYLASNADSTGKITVTNNQLYDKYVNGVWQNPYLPGQTVAFAPAANTYNALNFNILLPANLWFSNNKAQVSSIQIDPGDGSGYRALTPGTALAVTYSSTGLKTWNFKVTLTGGTVLLSHTQITVSGTTNTLTCYTAGCGTYTPPGGGGSGPQVKAAMAAQASTPADVISGTYPTYFFKTGATYNYHSALGSVTVQYASGHTSLVKPLIIAEGFDPGYYTKPESYTGLNTLSDFLTSLPGSPNNTLANLINSQYDIVYIDYKNGTDDIRRNALLVASIIRWVNANKTSTNSNVLLGSSMGGLCARYALKKMENNGETHQVSLFICHGTPQQGANVPVGLQDLETHAASVAVRTGAAGLYNTYRLIKPSAANYVGLLSLSNTPAAEQMLLTHVNPDFSIDNSVHNAWQSELSALGYPSQGGIKNVAISNGSECGQTQTLGQNGSILNLTGNVSTSFLGDLAIMVGGALASFTPLAPVTLLGGVPGRNALNANFQVNAAVDGGGNLGYSGKITYTKKILWFIPVTATLTNRSFNTPSGTYPYETFGGDFYGIPVNSFGSNSSGWFASKKITLNVAPSFGFVPTTSVLDIGNGTTTLSESDYLAAYTEAAPPSAPKSTPFSNFITAYSSPQITANNNEQHISFETRNSNWLAAELSGSTPVADCTALCQINTISGVANDCNSAQTYSVTSYSNVSYTWTYSSNLMLNTTTGPTVQATPKPGTPNGQQGYVSVTFYIKNASGTAANDCGTQTVTKTITIGVEPLVVTSSVDRTPEASHYQYLNASATQLPNTTSGNYTWWQCTNNQPTSQIGNGLNLNNYPMAPGTTLNYQCQAVTACGTTTYTSFAYNDYSGGSSSSADQSVMVYPNPANSAMSVTNKDVPSTTDARGNANGLIPQSYQIKVYDNFGRVLRTAKNVDGNATITFATKDIASGYYFLHIIKGDKVIKKQIIIQH